MLVMTHSDKTVEAKLSGTLLIILRDTYMLVMIILM